MTQPESHAEHKVASEARRRQAEAVLAQLNQSLENIRHAAAAQGGELSLDYIHETTCREFRIEVDEQENRFFLYEFVPNGRIAVFRGNEIIDVYQDPQIHQLEARYGPNKLVGKLVECGISPSAVIKTGGGYSVDSRYLSSLQECAEAIAQCLVDDRRYDCRRELTGQDKTRLAREEAKTSFAYWKSLEARQDAAMREPGIFKGCFGMMGPLTVRCKHEVLSYLNAPSSRTWLKIRGYPILGHSTLWQVWSDYDANAPVSGDEGFPEAETLRQAIRHAVAQRQIEIKNKLESLSASGLALVE